MFVLLCTEFAFPLYVLEFELRAESVFSSFDGIESHVSFVNSFALFFPTVCKHGVGCYVLVICSEGLRVSDQNVLLLCPFQFSECRLAGFKQELHVCLI